MDVRDCFIYSRTIPPRKAVTAPVAITVTGVIILPRRPVEDIIYMTILAVPSLESFTTSYDTTSIYGGYSSAPLAQVNTGASIEMGLKLSTVHNPKSNVLCELRVGDEP